MLVGKIRIDEFAVVLAVGLQGLAGSDAPAAEGIVWRRFRVQNVKDAEPHHVVDGQMFAKPTHHVFEGVVCAAGWRGTQFVP